MNEVTVFCRTAAISGNEIVHDAVAKNKANPDVRKHMRRLSKTIDAERNKRKKNK